MPQPLQRIAVAAVLAALGAGAHAVEYNQLIAEKSGVTFVSKQMNVPTEGKFKGFKSQVVFDPALPAKASIDFEIDMASIDVGSREANDEAKGKDWFNVKAFPSARFVSAAVKATGPNKFEVAGKLTIKSKTRDVVVPVSFRPDGSAGLFEGSFGIKRGEYGIGEGMWAAFDTVANEVQIKFRLLAAAGKK